MTNIDFYNKKLKRYLSEFNDWFSKVTFEASESSILDSIVGKIESDLIIGENTKNRTYKSVDLKDAKQATSMCSINDQLILLVDKRENRIIKYNSEFKACEQVSSIEGMRLNKPSLICSDEIEYVFICNSNGTEIIITDLSIKKINRVLNIRNDDYFQFIKDIKFFNGLLYVLDMEASAIDCYSFPFDKLNKKIRLKNDRNQCLENPISVTIAENTIAVLEDSRKIFIYNFDGDFIHKIFNENIGFIKSLCFASNYLFMHAGEGLFICYKMRDTKEFELLFEREITSLRETSESMIFFNKRITILLPYAKSFIFF